MKILVTGGMGFVGHNLVRQLIADGHEVHALGRSPHPPAEKLLPQLQYHCHDLSLNCTFEDWFDEVDTVFHVAAKAGMGGKEEDYRLANLVATELLLKTCQSRGVSRFIYTSTPSVTFSRKPICGGDESLPYSNENISSYAWTKSLAEQKVLSANDRSGMRTLALRPHLIWGAGDPHLLPRVISRHRRGKLKRVGDGKNKVDLTHIDNVVHAHLCAFESMISDPALGGRAYFIGQNEPVNLWNWLDQVFIEIDLPPLQKSVSYQTAYLLGGILEKTWGLFSIKSDPPMTRFVASQLAHDHWFSGTAAEQDLKYQPVIGMADALHKTLPWLQSL
jgi:nucleoside-diphosphate-sugar epimerase